MIKSATKEQIIETLMTHRGHTKESAEASLSKMIEGGIVEKRGDRYFPTDHGHRIALAAAARKLGEMNSGSIH